MARSVRNFRTRSTDICRQTGSATQMILAWAAKTVGIFAERAMTTIRMTQGPERAIAQPLRSAGMARRVFLVCGVLSSLLYVLTDVLGGLRYDGYSFTSRAISELSAIGAPSKPFVDPLFLAYDFLVLAFAIGVLRAAAGRNRALRSAAVALIAYGAIGIIAGLIGPFFSMHQRGVGSVATDAPHIVLTGVLVLLLLLAIGFGAFALGNRFRVYSLVTLATVILFGALTTPYPARMDAGQATPGLGIIERIDVYSALLWLAVLASALLRRPDTATDG
jgi:hypothetical membrane protein